MFRTLRFYHSFFKFLSTPSSRRATGAARHHATVPTYFYPRPPRGGRHHDYARNGQSSSNFYPRPPRGGRPTSSLCHAVYSGFLSTPSARRATTESANLPSHTTISIHALREEGDVSSSGLPSNWNYFYPRPPRGGRQQKQRENTLLLSHYTPPCTNCKEMSVNQTAKLHRYLRKRLVFRCEASRKTMCAADSHWPDIKRSARCLGQILGAVQRARPWSGSCCPAGRTADCPRQGRSGRSALL